MNDGGPAFPATYDKKFPGGLMPGSGQIHSVSEPGMSLRDYFAAQALMMVFVVADRVESEISNEGAAKVAYHVADCMLAERAKP